jgi:hypothetical protein
MSTCKHPSRVVCRTQRRWPGSLIAGRAAARRTARQRRGGALILAAFVLVFMIVMVAFAVDIGYMVMARTELQRTADAAALAAAWELVPSESDYLTDPLQSGVYEKCYQRAAEYAAVNVVCAHAPALSQGNTGDEDVTVGRMDMVAPDYAMHYDDPSQHNVVRVRARRHASQNGAVSLFFGRMLGLSGVELEAEALAGVYKQVRGFRSPGGSGNVEMLPFALDLETWNAMLDGLTPDQWTWNPVSGTITSGPDGIREVNLYPQGTGSPGNRGTVDIGSPNNSTADIARQIVNGISPADLAYLGGSIELDSNGELLLNGDTGISAGVKDELASIKGQPRIIPIFSQVAGPGNNATYTIVKFAGVRILDVKLTGSMSSKRVIVQPANVVANGVLPSDEAESSYFIYSPPFLIQ